MSTIRGAKVVQHSIRDMSLADVTDQNQMKASATDPDLRKKLRVERAKKLTMGNSAMCASVDDPSQPDWLKSKSLKEIEIIRETKRDQLVNA